LYHHLSYCTAFIPFQHTHENSPKTQHTRAEGVPERSKAHPKCIVIEPARNSSETTQMQQYPDLRPTSLPPSYILHTRNPHLHTSAFAPRSCRLLSSRASTPTSPHSLTPQAGCEVAAPLCPNNMFPPCGTAHSTARPSRLWLALSPQRAWLESLRSTGPVLH